MTQKEKFSSEGYNISIVGKHVQITDAMKQYVLEKLSKIDRFTNRVLDVTVTMDIQKLSHSVSILMKFLHINIKVNAITTDMYSAIDKAIDKLIKLINKYKKRLQSKRIEHLATTDMKVNVLSYPENELEEINSDIEAETLRKEEELYKLPEIVATEKMALKTLTQEEAIMKMDLTGKHFIIYRGEEDRKLKVIYHREDGKFAIIEAE